MLHKGYATIVDPEGLSEWDTTSCGHCQRIIYLKPGAGVTVYRIYHRHTRQWTEEAGAFCRVCMRPVCLSCHGIGTCTPFEKTLERLEARR